MPEGSRGGYRGALSHRDFRLLIGRSAVSAAGSWAYNVGLIVFVFDRTGSAAWLSAIAVARFLPAMIASPYGGVLAERFERRTVMLVSDLAAMGTMGALAVLAFLDGPVWVALVLGAATSVVTIVDQPALAAMVPQVVGEDDLPAANALNGTVENLSVVVGPALGAGLLVFMDAGGVFLVNAISFGVAALFLVAMRTRSRPTDVTEGGEAGVVQQLAVGFRAISSDTKAFVLVLLSVVASFVYGTDIVLYALVGDRVGFGPDGFGYLLAGAGVGGVLAAGTVNKLAGSSRLGVVLTVGMALYLLPTAVLTFTDNGAVAIGLQVVRGAGTLVVDVLAITALQRTLAPELLARVFGVFTTYVLLAIALGSLVTPPIIDAVGLDGALWVMSVGLMALVLLTWPWLRVVDRVAAARAEELDPRVRALSELGIFGRTSRPVLERLSAAATEVTTVAGETLISEGEPADAFYVLLDGTLVVSARGEGRRRRKLRDLQPPAYVGEIGLIERVPRTATVVAETPSRLLRIEGDDFLDAVMGAPASASFVETSVLRYATTHPSRTAAAPEVIVIADPEDEPVPVATAPPTDGETSEE